MITRAIPAIPFTLPQRVSTEVFFTFLQVGFLALKVKDVSTGYTKDTYGDICNYSNFGAPSPYPAKVPAMPTGLTVKLIAEVPCMKALPSNRLPGIFSRYTLPLLLRTLVHKSNTVYRPN